MPAPDRAYDVIVIGVGAMGAATSMHLARRGARVLGLERATIPNNEGSSHGHSRLIRVCYYEHPDYVPLLLRALQHWRELERASGRVVFHQTGALYVGDPDGALVRESARSGVRFGVPHELLDERAIRSRFPQLNPPVGAAGLLEPLAGALLCETAIEAFAAVARRAGAELHEREPVEGWTSDGAHVEVRTARGVYGARSLVLTAGAWSRGLAPGLAPRLAVTRQSMGWVAPRRPELFGPESFPCWAVEQPDGSLHYGFPILPGREGMKVAHHLNGAPTDPATIDRAPTPSDEAGFRAALGSLAPFATGPTLRTCVCMYTNTPDGHFAVGALPGLERVWVGCGFSGHGFKFAPVVGEALADLAQRGRSDLPIDFLSPARILNGPTPREA